MGPATRDGQHRHHPRRTAQDESLGDELEEATHRKLARTPNTSSEIAPQRQEFHGVLVGYPQYGWVLSGDRD